MTVRKRVFQYKFQHALPLVVVLADIIPLYFLPKVVVVPAMAALTVTLLCLNRKKLHIHHLPVFLLWGAFASCVIAFRYVPDQAPLPKSLSKVTALEGVLVADARRTARGSYIYELRLENVEMQNISQTMDRA
ncbi:MAG: hypothetical protein IKT97_04115, partial [Spirochaetia bacterium]|nr:hypothetical protein [Spirochaetia bacterium]